MKIYIIELIIPSILMFFCNINSSNAYSCNTTSCPSSSTGIVSVHSPFRLKFMQSMYCGESGFDLYCNDTLGTTIRLPRDVVLRVDEIDYVNEELILSDRYDDCLPQKLLSLNLTDTPFRQITNAEKLFWLYNCSGVDDLGYDRIDCLSGSSYTVISSRYGTNDVVRSSCSFIAGVAVPTYHRSSSLSQISTIALTWSAGPREVPPANPRQYSNSKGFPISPIGMILGLMGTAIGLLTILCYCCRRHFRRNQQSSSMNSQTPAVVAGLNQVIIDSYPVVVVGESGRLSESDDTICSICLSDYSPGETLKMLPGCLHRFHAECIDQWLRSKGVCPICRASTPITSSNC